MPATSLEQLILELVNRARLDPAAEAARYGIDLNEGVPADQTISTASKQPLAMNETLLGVARAHSQDMIDRDYFAHDTPEGVTPFQRMTNAGYNFTTAGENIAFSSTSGAVTNQMTADLHQLLFVDPNFPGRGHRVNILLGDYQEIGVGQVTGDYRGSNATMLTEDFAARGSQQFLTGVSYADADHDNFYSVGEGRGSMSVVAGSSTSTGAAGGYSLAVSSGLRTVSFSGGGLTSSINVSVSIAANTNAKVDVIDQGTIATSTSLTDLGGATTIMGLGTFGLALTGDSGNDRFIGTRGNDTIDGAGGSDTVVFSGNFSAYTRTNLANGSIQIAGPDGTDTLSNVELLQFKDQSITVGAVPGSVVINDQTLSEGDSGTKVATFTVTRSGGTAAFDVNFATASGTASAVAGTGDYGAVSGTLHFGEGVDTMTVPVTIYGDLRLENNETFTVNLSGATNGATIGDGQGLGTITNDDQFHFMPSAFKFGAFGPGSDGWVSQERFPRELADVNGDHMADIVGFGGGGVYVSLATGDGAFGPIALKLAGFGSEASAGGWISDDKFPRQLADVNGDGLADIVGFGGAGVYVSLATGGGSFGPMSLKRTDFGTEPSAGGWSGQDRFPRELADVNGDHMADIVGFGGAGVYVSLATGNGSFGPISLKRTDFGTEASAGGWVSDEKFPRQLADVNNDGMADIVGFGAAGVYVSLATGGGSFGPLALKVSNFGSEPSAGGWSGYDRFPRELADINGDGKIDIVGFGGAGVYVAFGNGDGSFRSIIADLHDFGAEPSAGGWVGEDRFPRHLADVNGDGAADIIGFGYNGVYESLSSDFHLI